MNREYRTDDWNNYRMDYVRPHLELEPLEKEIAVVDGVLACLKSEGMLPHTEYDHDKMLAHRKAVSDNFEIPWTAITPRMQRLLYAINAIIQPANMIAAGCFCGNTFISNAGAGAGPGACYTPKNLIGIEILPSEAARAERNVRKIDSTGVARIVSEDAIETVANFTDDIQLLYLDADDEKERSKSIYMEIIEACYDKLPAGSLVLAHNSINFAERLSDYLVFARNPVHFKSSINVVLDIEGLEVSCK